MSSDGSQILSLWPSKPWMGILQASLPAPCPPSSAAPIGSISSMEVNVDTLEQVELIDLADQDGADVFLPCEDSPPTPQMSGMPFCLADLGTIWLALDV